MTRKKPQLSQSDLRQADVAAADDLVVAIRWLPAAVGVLVASRFFLPAESAAQGETLWIVLFWLICGTLWLFGLTRTDEPFPRPDWLSAGIGLLVGGHVVAAVGVLMTEGDKRAALNMLWEWVGIGMAALLIRRVMRSRDGRSQLLSTILISGVVLAGLGIWQHYVWYPQISAQLTNLAELKAESADDDPAALRARLDRIDELQREMGWTAATKGTSEQMFRDRVQGSTEPIGRFALANTFAGLLIAALFVGLARLRRLLRGSFKFVSASGLFIGLLLVGYCLWLTKSRTAWIGVVAGMVAAGIVARRAKAGLSISLYVVSAGAMILVGMPLVAFLTGSLDWQVVSEAPKSLLYRLEYWQGTARLLGDHWLLGVGPGNFRQHYLQYKLAGSSEEILDPHNLFLDVWANGGLLALAGLIVILVIAARHGLSSGEKSATLEQTAEWRPIPKAVRLGLLGTAAMAIAAFCEMLGGTAGGGQWIALLIGWWIAAFGLIWAGDSGIGRALTFAALVGLVVHLTGAGGIAMPAMTQLVLILVFAATDQFDASHSVVVASPPRFVQMGAPLISLGLVIGCAVTAAIPVTKARASLNIGRSLWLADHQLLAAADAFERATSDDRLFADPWQELASVRFARWTQTRDDRDFERAVSAQREAIARDPQNAGRWRMLGQLWSQRYERDSDRAAAESAFAAYSEAVKRYPHLAEAQAQLAVAARQADEPNQAKRAARIALKLDEMNRSRGHIDKYLTDERLAELGEIAGVDSAESEE